MQLMYFIYKIITMLIILSIKNINKNNKGLGMSMLFIKNNKILIKTKISLLYIFQEWVIQRK